MFLSPTGTIVGGDAESMNVGNAYMTPFFGAQSGNEYGNTKLVYLSPSLAGFDFGFQYAPNPFNGYAIGNGGLSGGVACNSALGGVGCPNLSSSSTTVGGNFGSRTENQYAVGARYRACSVERASSPMAFTWAAAPSNTPDLPPWPRRPDPPATHYTGKYDGLNLGSIGVNVTYAGFSVFGNTLFGAVNGVLAARPQGGAMGVGWVAGVKYVVGPYSIGALYGSYNSQGAQQLTGLTQRRENVVYVAGTYAVSPGLTVALDYVYGTRYQGDYNFATGGFGGAYNNVSSQGVMLSTSVKW